MLVWVIALGGTVLAVTAIQVAAYYYLVHDDGPTGPVEVDSEPDPTGGTASASDRRRREADRSDDGGRPARRRCSACGTPNAADPVFTFCRNCGEEL